METKCIAVKVGKPLWKAISVAAMEEEKSLQDLIVPVLEKEFGGLIQRSAKTPAIERKSVSVDSGYVDLNKMPPVVKNATDVKSEIPDTPFKPGPKDIYSIERKNCGNCGESFPVELLELVRIPGTTRSKSLCKGCIDNMKNGQ